MNGDTASASKAQIGSSFGIAALAADGNGTWMYIVENKCGMYRVRMEPPHTIEVLESMSTLLALTPATTDLTWALCHVAVNEAGTAVYLGVQNYYYILKYDLTTRENDEAPSTACRGGRRYPWTEAGHRMPENRGLSVIF